MVDRGLLLPTVTKLSAGSNGRILTPKDLVKYKFATGQSFSLSGRGMIDDVDGPGGADAALGELCAQKSRKCETCGIFSADREGFEPSVRF